MTITITVKRTPGTKEKDRQIEIVTLERFDLADAKVLWEFEQLINGKTTSRIHVDLQE